MQIAQWKCRKTKLKLKFIPNAKPTATYVRSVPSSTDSFLGSPNKMAENADDEELDALGVDLEVVEMTFTKTDSAYATLCLSAGSC